MAEGVAIGKYRIVEELGSGGFATVFKAVDSTLGREVALKVLHPPLLVDKGFVERFFREARTLARLRHPNIVIIHEVSAAEGRVFLAMDLAASSLARAIVGSGERPF
jgi:serine/threonine protein kinase